MGKVTGLNPAMMMLSLSVWGKLLGLLGMIIALPVTYLLLVYYRRLIQTTPSLGSSSQS
jgi:predicted PurR-regulated permease PerM